MTATLTRIAFAQAERTLRVASTSANQLPFDQDDHLHALADIVGGAGRLSVTRDVRVALKLAEDLRLLAQDIESSTHHGLVDGVHPSTSGGDG
jgi:hypothetical protein